MQGVVAKRTSSQGQAVLQFLMRAAISLVLLWLPLRHVAVGAVMNQMATINYLSLLAGLAAFVGSTLVAALRWSLILGALKTPRAIGLTYPLSLIGIFFGQALPAGVGGDVVRVWLGCKSGLSTRTAVSSILGDRLSGFLSILLIVTIELAPIHDLIKSKALFGGLLSVLALGYFAIVVAMLLDKLPANLQRFRVVRAFSAVSNDLRSALFSPFGIPVLLCGAVIQIANVVVVYALCEGLHLNAGFLDCLLIVPFANVLQTIPVSVAGWGVRESFFVAAFGLLGIAPSAALAVSVLFGLLFLVSSLPGGVLWLVRGGGSPLKAREVVEPVVSSE